MVNPNWSVSELPRGRRKKGLDSYQKATSEKNREIVEKALNRFLAVGTNPKYPDMKREIGQICKEENTNPLSKQTIYKYWKPLRKKFEEDREKSKPKKFFRPVDFNVVQRDFDPVLKKFENERQRLRNSPVKHFFSLVSGKLLKLDYAHADRLRTTHEDSLRKREWLDHSLDVKIKPSSQSLYFEAVMDYEISKFITKMFYPYFFWLGFYKKPETIKPVTFEVKFDPLEGTINFLEKEIAELERRLISKHLIDSFEETLELLKRDHIEHYRLNSIQNKTYNREEFEEFKKNIQGFTKNQVLVRLEKERKNFRFPPSKWWKKLKEFLSGPPIGFLINQTTGKVNRNVVNDYRNYYGWGPEKTKEFIELAKKNWKRTEK